MKKYRGYYNSSNGVNRIAYYAFIPDGKPRCIVQIMHGMCEHAMMYGEFMRFLAENGCAACACDSLGHGRSISSGSDVGYFADKDGWKCLVDDEKCLTDIMKRKIPDVPLFLIGHSMGSFIEREYLVRYQGCADGAVIIGTSDGYSVQGVVTAMAKLLCLFAGKRYRLIPAMRMACGFFCVKMHTLSLGWDWLSREAKIRAYMDRFHFNYTAGGYCDIITLLNRVSSARWLQKVPKDIPVMLMSGLSDPVGNCGKSVTELYRKLKGAGCSDISVRLYNDARHMLLHEINRKQVYNDIMNWIEKELTE